MSEFMQGADRAVGAAVCQWLNGGLSAAASTFVIKGLLTPGAQVPSAAAGLGLLALHYGCGYDPGGEYPPSIPQLDGCKKATGRLRVSQKRGAGEVTFKAAVKEITGWSMTTKWGDCVPGGTGNTTPRIVISYIDAFTGESKNECFAEHQDGDTYESKVIDGTCVVQNVPEPGPLPPVEHIDVTTNCEYNVQFMAWDLQDDGNVRPVVKISPGTSTFASGGIVSGCNFPPVVYHGPGGGGGDEPPHVYPWNPGPDGPNGEPWWAPFLRGAVAGATSAAVGKLLDEMFKKEVAGRPYRLVSVCEVDGEGEPVSLSREVQIPALPLLEGAIYRLDAIEYLMQGLKDFKQPICPPVKVEQLGELVTVHFKSLDASPGSPRQLRKILRYRDQTFADACEHANHWLGFEWDAGPVCVISKNLEWGVPQVWASSADEGKRVLRHAAAIAGIDLGDQRHEWVVRHTTDTRVGRSGRMRLEGTISGVVKISKRDGPSGPPEYPYK